jgi:hypothetical protein
MQTELLLKKGPSPLSYRELDSGLGQELSETYGSHYGTMVAHGFFMTLAFAIALPLCKFLSLVLQPYVPSSHFFAFADFDPFTN